MTLYVQWSADIQQSSALPHAYTLESFLLDIELLVAIWEKLIGSEWMMADKDVRESEAALDRGRRYKYILRLLHGSTGSWGDDTLYSS
jgi:hypothetical protein